MAGRDVCALGIVVVGMAVIVSGGSRAARADEDGVVTAAAAPLERSPWAFGARIGGYGFRAVDSSSWQDCRMDGVGVFAERALGGGPFFVEAAVDLYFTDGFIVADSPADAGVDRFSGLTTIAAGARMWPRAVVSPYVQVGTGLEITHVSIDDGVAGSFVLPLGFVGIGGDVALGDQLRLGMTMRALVMADFDYAWTQSSLSPEYRPAAQIQFYARYAL